MLLSMDHNSACGRFSDVTIVLGHNDAHNLVVNLLTTSLIHKANGHTWLQANLAACNHLSSLRGPKY
jgi:hypothetical protein